MNRDILLAITIGFGLGLLITSIVVLSPQLLRMLPTLRLPQFVTQKTPNVSMQNSPADTNEFVLTIQSPLPESIVTSSDLVLSGTTNADSVVVMTGQLDEDVVVTPSEGKYTGKVTLLEGKNEITVTSLWDQREQTKRIVVYYTQESL